MVIHVMVAWVRWMTSAASLWALGWVSLCNCASHSLLYGIVRHYPCSFSSDNPKASSTIIQASTISTTPLKCIGNTAGWIDSYGNVLIGMSHGFAGLLLLWLLVQRHNGHCRCQLSCYCGGTGVSVIVPVIPCCMHSFFLIQYICILQASSPPMPTSPPLPMPTYHPSTTNQPVDMDMLATVSIAMTVAPVISCCMYSLFVLQYICILQAPSPPMLTPPPVPMPTYHPSTTDLAWEYGHVGIRVCPEAKFCHNADI